MANLLHSKGSRTQIYKTLPSSLVGNDALSIQFGDSLIEDLSSGLTSRPWMFNHNNINSKNKIDHLDVRVTLAASNFAVSEFSNSVLHIQTILDGLSNSGTFEPDVNTVQGTIAKGVRSGSQSVRWRRRSG